MRIKEIRKNPILDSILEDCFMKKLEENLSYKELREHWNSQLERIGLKPSQFSFPSKPSFLRAYKEYLKDLGFKECQVCGKIVKRRYEEYIDGEVVKVCRECWKEIIRYKSSPEYLRKILQEGIVRRGE